MPLCQFFNDKLGDIAASTRDENLHPFVFSVSFFARKSAWNLFLPGACEFPESGTRTPKPERPLPFHQVLSRFQVDSKVRAIGRVLHRQTIFLQRSFHFAQFQINAAQEVSQIPVD